MVPSSVSGRVHRSSVQYRRRLIATGTAVGICAAVNVAVLGSGTTAQSAPSPCPPAFQVRNLSVGQPVEGLTVSRGTEPEAFTGEVLGVLDNGIAPGLDMIVTRLTSPEIDRVGGIWAGMSGSPVYAANGRLVGAVAYSLSFGGVSPVAGVTPAADMQALLRNPPGGSAATLRRIEDAEPVDIPQRLGNRLLASGLATPAEVDSGLSRLPLLLGVSGITTQQRLRQMKRRLGLGDALVFPGGAGASATPGAITAGGNIAASISYGDVASYGVGTTTAVCGREVLAFGHPALFQGRSRMTMHAARAVLVQESALFAYKVANLGAPAGRITDDRLAGLRGVRAAPPATTRVTSHVASTEGASRNGTTLVSVPAAVPGIGASHLDVNMFRTIDKFGQGSALLRTTIAGVRGNGQAFSLSVGDRYASGFDIAFETAFESFALLRQVVGNPFEQVRITSVRYRALVNPVRREFEVDRLRVRRDGRWARVGRVLTVRPGQRLRVRAVLTSPRDASGTRRVDRVVRVPRGTSGAAGSLQVLGGASTRDRIRAGSFDALLRALSRKVRNDELRTSLTLSRGRRQVQRDSRTLVGDVVGGSIRVRVRVR